MSVAARAHALADPSRLAGEGVVGSETLVGRRRWDVAADYLSLTKPRVIVLLEITTLFAMVMAARGWPSPGLVAATLIGGALAAGAANTLNCWYDRDIDAAMGRTHARPLPAGRITPTRALVFGIVLAASSFVLIARTSNVLAAALAMAALLFYVLVYTMYLKRSSMQNIVIGGAAGAVPPLVGWAAVQGKLGLTAIFLFAIIFYWTPPHFWALALLIRRDYADVGVPMLPVVVGDRRARVQILLWTVVLTVVTLLPFAARSFGVFYLVGTAILDAGFVVGAVQAVRDPSARTARRLFYYSMVYLALLFAVMAADRVLGAALLT